MKKMLQNLIIFMCRQYKASPLELDVSLPAVYWEH